MSFLMCLLKTCTLFFKKKNKNKNKLLQNKFPLVHCNGPKLFNTFIQSKGISDTVVWNAVYIKSCPASNNCCQDVFYTKLISKSVASCIFESWKELCLKVLFIENKFKENNGL